uniref:Uncharacterized protein n=1 Tax=Panagrolaimus superbus TaxID=310955 RepID=A0A914XWJ2_9BILA
MRNHFDHYNCTIDGGINQFSIYLRSAYGSALFDINNELTERELNIIKKFTEQVLKKKSYVAKGEPSVHMFHVLQQKEVQSHLLMLFHGEVSKQLIDKMDKRDLFLQACEIIEKTKELHPVISGLFIFAALIAEATVDDDENYLDKIKNIVDDDFGIEITTGPLSFEVLNEAVDHFVKAKKEYFVDNDEDEAAEISSELDSVFDDTENEEDFFGASFEDSRNEVTKYSVID